MIYTKHAVKQAIGTIDPSILEQIEADYIGIPRALRDCAVEILVNGDCSGDTDMSARWNRAVALVREALIALNTVGYLVYGNKDEF